MDTSEHLSTSGDDRSFTFAVDKVELIKNIPPLSSAEDILRNVIGIKTQSEDFSHREDKQQIFIKGYIPGFILALHTAYHHHYSLKLSVSDFVILIGQGLGKHIEKHAEDLRKFFVNHQGKELIELSRDNFVKGQQNDWSSVFGEFAEELKKRVKTDIYNVVIDDTSVATKTSRIVSEITLMDTMKSYFSYGISTCCGIPKITLEGSREDWQKLKAKVQSLQEMNKDNCLKLDWWLTALIPVVEKICHAGINREVDAEFWSGIYKYKNPGSGTPYISGWITTFLPYLASGANYFGNSRIETNNIPKQICKVPFTWTYYQEKIPMEFYGGFLGASFDEKTFTVKAAHFWSVNYKQEDNKEK